MKNGRGSADRLTLVAPAGGCVSGQIYVVGALAFVAEGTVAADELVSAVTRYEITYPKSGGAVAMGATAFYKSSDNTVTGTSASGLVPVGYFSKAAATGNVDSTIVLTGERTAAV